MQVAAALVQCRLEAAIVALPGVDGAAAAASVMDLPDRSASNAAICDAGSSGVSSTGTVVRVVLAWTRSVDMVFLAYAVGYGCEVSIRRLHFAARTAFGQGGGGQMKWLQCQ